MKSESSHALYLFVLPRFPGGEPHTLRLKAL
jgi:hypothetical protein